MKKLFAIKTPEGKLFKSVGIVVYCDSKAVAKELRDHLNEANCSNGYHVTRGEDNKKSPKPHKRTVSSKKTTKWTW